jgi:acetoin:2,6-dichlorophenolindophenol oxidoreductase subunit beta
MTVLDALNGALHHAMDASASVYMLGEDILDPYGGAFKVTRGLSTRFPDRVWTTPISEAAITGIAAGMALRGLRPVVEIMFGDFLSLVQDQILNHATKFRWMYNGKVRVPMVIRAPMGGRRGYGPTHSQCTEKLFLGVPGLRIIACNAFSDPHAALSAAILDGEDPVLFVEHKLLYGCKMRDTQNIEDLEVEQSGGPWPTQTLRFRGAVNPELTFVSYGYMAELVYEAMMTLALEFEIFSEAVIYSQLKPLEAAPLLRSAVATRCLVTVEEGGVAAGWGSEAIATVAELLPSGKAVRSRRVGAKDIPIPSTRPLEAAALPSVRDIVRAALSLTRNADG